MILTTHTDKYGNPKLVQDCEFPLTAPATVDLVITDLAMIRVTPEGFLVEEMLEGLSREELQAKTGAPLRFSDSVRALTVPEV